MKDLVVMTEKSRMVTKYRGFNHQKNLKPIYQLDCIHGNSRLKIVMKQETLSCPL